MSAVFLLVHSIEESRTYTFQHERDEIVEGTEVVEWLSQTGSELVQSAVYSRRGRTIVTAKKRARRSGGRKFESKMEIVRERRVKSHEKGTISEDAHPKKSPVSPFFCSSVLQVPMTPVGEEE